jgi:ketosteroid isomerase-like protein
MRPSVLAACALAAACGGRAQKETTPAPAGDTVAAAQRALETWRQAYEVHSFDALAPLYAHDPATVVVAQGVPYTGWDKAAAHLQDLLGHAKEIHVRLHDVTVDAIDLDCAVVVVQMDRDISDGTVTTSEHGVLTLVLHQTGGQWLVTSEHYSYPHSS